MKSIKSLFILLILILITVSSRAAEETHYKIRRKAQNSYNNGNLNDAYEQYHKLIFETQNDPKRVGQDFTRAWQCLRQLSRLHELDTFREQAIQAHSGNWRLLRDAARSYSQNTHWGYKVAGEFHRGSHR